MKASTINLHNLLVLFLTMVFAAGSALASTNFSTCPSSGSPVTIATIVGSANGNGCSDSDKTLSDFSVMNGSGKSNSGVSQTDSSVLFGTSDTFTSSSVPWTVTSAFTPNGSAWTLTGASGTTTQGVLNYDVDSTGANNGSYPAGGPFYITGVSLNIAGTTGIANADGAPDMITVTKVFCVGTGACTGADEVTLTAVIGNNSSTVNYSCTAGAGISGDVTGCSGTPTTSPENVVFTTIFPTTLDVTDTYTLVVHSGTMGDMAVSTTDSLTNMNDVFGEAAVPEPSTLLLLGTALAGIGLAGFRRRKKDVEKA